MKTRKRFVRVVIAVAVVMLLFMWFVEKWRYDVAIVPFLDGDSIPVSFVEYELVCYKQLLTSYFFSAKLMSFCDNIMLLASLSSCVAFHGRSCFYKFRSG